MTEFSQHPASAVETGDNENKSFLWGSRRLDFWLIGGLSLVCWAPVWLFQKQFGGNPWLLYYVSWSAFYLAFVVNYPHFMASYKLAYTQGQAFVRDNWFQLIAVPVSLLLLIVLAPLLWRVSTADNGLIQGINALFAGLGLATRLGQYSSLGAEIMGLLVNLMFFTVGWHYAKQTFGCMMVYARLDGYTLSNLQRNLVRYTLLSTWWVTWLNVNCSPGSYGHYGLSIYRLNLPTAWLQISYVVVAMMYAALLVMLIAKLRQDGQRPSANFLVAGVALAVWHVPIFSSPLFFYFLAFFHSLQYFPFVARLEQTRYRKAGHAQPWRRLGGFFGIMFVLGTIAFYFAPTGLDELSDAYQEFGANFFMIAFLAFINIHHYFIDNVLWRFKNREMREYLFD